MSVSLKCLEALGKFEYRTLYFFENLGKSSVCPFIPYNKP